MRQRAPGSGLPSLLAVVAPVVGPLCCPGSSVFGLLRLCETLDLYSGPVGASVNWPRRCCLPFSNQQRRARVHPSLVCNPSLSRSRPLSHRQRRSVAALPCWRRDVQGPSGHFSDQTEATYAERVRSGRCSGLIAVGFLARSGPLARWLAGWRPIRSRKQWPPVGHHPDQIGRSCVDCWCLPRKAVMQILTLLHPHHPVLSFECSPRSQCGVLWRYRPGLGDRRK